MEATYLYKASRTSKVLHHVRRRIRIPWRTDLIPWFAREETFRPAWRCVWRLKLWVVVHSYISLRWPCVWCGQILKRHSQTQYRCALFKNYRWPSIGSLSASSLSCPFGYLVLYPSTRTSICAMCNVYEIALHTLRTITSTALAVIGVGCIGASVGKIYARTSYHV